LHFSLWDKEHEKQRPLRDFEITLFDIDYDKSHEYEEYLIAEPSAIASIGSRVQVRGDEGSKKIFRALPFDHNVFDTHSFNKVRKSHLQVSVRLSYNHVDEFTLTLPGKSRHIGFMLHDPQYRHRHKEAPVERASEDVPSCVLAGTCATNHIIQEVIHEKWGLSEGIQYSVTRYGGGMDVKHLRLDIGAPSISQEQQLVSFDRSGHRLWRIRLEDTSKPIDIRFSLWDARHSQLQTLREFEITFFDIGLRNGLTHSDLMTVEPNLLKCIGSEVQAEGTKHGKTTLQPAPRESVSLDARSRGHISDVITPNMAMSARLVYDNVQEFVVTVGGTDRSTNIGREIVFALGDLGPCT